MKIFFNNEIVDLPNDYMTMEDLVKWKNLQTKGIAIALNNKIIRKANWSVTPLHHDDHVTVITAAFGG